MEGSLGGVAGQEKMWLGVGPEEEKTFWKGICSKDGLAAGEKRIRTNQTEVRQELMYTSWFS